jgi:iron complex outermembrane receptor protein
VTGYSGVVWLDSNTPNNNPTRGQIAQFGNNFLLTSDSNAAELNAAGNCISASNCLFPLNYKFYTYHVPTDVEYVDWKSQFGHGWQLDFEPYTLSYYNKQFYNNSLTSVNATSAVDKLNSYRKYGENAVVSQVSKYGILRTGLWYEWATTNRFQIPSNPLTLADTFLPNFHERFYTNSAQPYVEYEYHATQKFTVTAGFKYSYINQNLTQFQDNGKIVGCLGGTLVGGKTGKCVGGLDSVNHSAGYSSYLPSFDANYHIKNNWSVYGQFGTGAVVPPSSVFDVTGANVVIVPKPTYVRTYQGGSVLKLKQVTLNADVYYARFQNAYSSVTDPNNTTGFDWIASGDSVTKGFEGEVNVYVTRGLSFYVNGTAGTAKYVSNGFANKGLWVANTPSNTQAYGATYQQKHFDLGVFDKRVGPMWNDNTPFNQVIPIAPFNITNVYVNYVIKNGSHFDQTKFRLSVNNLFDSHNIVGVTQAATGAVYSPGAGDLLTLLPGRSITMTVTLGYSTKTR